MKFFFNHSWRVLLASIILYIVWVLSLSLAENFIEPNLKTADAPEALSALLFFIVCIVNSGILYVTVINSRWTGIRLIIAIFSLLYFIQFFLSMIEAIWFNNSLNMSTSGIYYILLAGFIMAVIYAPIIVVIGRKMKTNSIDYRKNKKITLDFELLFKILILIIIVYPMLYNLAGYFIAWQFEAVRLFYTDSIVLDPFGKMLWNNIKEGLYTFQILRGTMWVILGLMVYQMTKGNYIKKGILTGLLFALLMNSQHLVPNPYFPREVAFAHFIETASSNFIWGFIIVWLIHWKPKNIGSTSS